MSHTLNITGPLPDTEVKRILLGLCAALHAQHAVARVHGGLSPAAVVLDEDGAVQRLGGGESRQDGYAAFECYADDPAWPIGTWTDMYALGAIGHALMLGYPPAPAIARQRQPGRRVFSDATMSETPLGRAIIHALELVPAVRTQNVMQFLHDAGWPLSALPPVPVPLPLAEAEPAGSAVPAIAAQAPIDTKPARAAVQAMAAPVSIAAATAGAAVQAETARAPVGPDAAGAPVEAEVVGVPAPASAKAALQPAPPDRAHAPDTPSNRMPLTGMVAIALLFVIAGALWWFNREAASPQGPSQQAAATAGSGSNNRTPLSGGTSASPATPTPVPDTVPEPPALPGYGPSAPTAASPATTAPPSPATTAPPPPPPSPATTSSATTTSPATTTLPDATAGTSSSPANAPEETAASGAAEASSSGQADAPATGAPDSVAGVSSGATGSTTASETRSAADPAPVASQGATGERATTATASSTDTPSTSEPEAPAVRNMPVSVSVQPWGEVFINGASRGVSPPLQSLTLAPGTYRVTIQNPNAEPYHTRVTVIAGQPARIQHTFR